MAPRLLPLLLFFILPFIGEAQSDFVSGEYLFKLEAGVTPQEITLKANSQFPYLHLQIKKEVAKRFNIWLLEGNLGNERENISFFQKMKGVESVQLNHKVTLRNTVPNDPSFTQQWAFKNNGENGGTEGADIDATLAWDITTGGVTALGDTIVIAVIDEGFQLNHPDLIQNFFRNTSEIPGNGIDDDQNGYIDDVSGWNAYNNTGAIPLNAHGTHVSGIVSARGNNGAGVSGVNWTAKILPIAGSSGDESTVIAAYAYAAEMRIQYDQSNGLKGAFVVATNSSFGVDLGNPEEFPIWCAFYDTLGAHGILSAGATANANTNVDQQGDIPTACASQFLIAVTNSTRSDVKYSNAGYGVNSIDIAAPGTSIYSTVTNSNYQNLTGTSMATPMVAGAIGLMYAAACDKLIVDYKLNPAAISLQMRQYLLSGAEVIPAFDTKVNGSRRLNLFGALIQVQSYICSEGAIPYAAFSAPARTGCPGLSVSYNNTTSSNATSFSWRFPGGSPSVSTEANPVVTYGDFGAYDAQLIAINSFGADTLILPNFVTVTNTGLRNVYTETFENGTLSASGWMVENPDQANTWDLFTVGGTTPGSNAAGVSIYTNQDKQTQRDYLISPLISLAQTTQNTLSFEHAHRRRISGRQDSLIVSVTTNNGLNWQRVLAIAGPDNLATGTLLATNFVPTTATDWCIDGTVGVSCSTIDLASFDGQQIRLRFETYNDGGNNIYIDNIALNGICTNSISLEPVANFENQTLISCTGIPIMFTNQSVNATHYDWTFEGPDTLGSTFDNPSVIFENPGIYSVTLIASNSQFSDTIFVADQIIVKPSPSTPIVEISGTQLSTTSMFVLQWYLNGVALIGENNQVIEATLPGIYTVVALNDEGCESSSVGIEMGTSSIENREPQGFSMFPNPAGEYLTITSASHVEWNVEITDLSGRRLWEAMAGSSSKEIIPLGNFQPGIYLVKITTSQGMLVKKMLH